MKDRTAHIASDIKGPIRIGSTKAKASGGQSIAPLRRAGTVLVTACRSTPGLGAMTARAMVGIPREPDLAVSEGQY